MERKWKIGRKEGERKYLLRGKVKKFTHAHCFSEGHTDWCFDKDILSGAWWVECCESQPYCPTLNFTGKWGWEKRQQNLSLCPEVIAFQVTCLAGLRTLHLDFQAPTTDLWFNKALKSIAGEVTKPSAEATAPPLLHGRQAHFEILCWCPETGTVINATWERVFTLLQWAALTSEVHGLSSAEREWLVGARTHSSSV